ncbi:HAD-IA family hydrolase [Luteimonas saliphila]|uniref:HAD-IA family hydrolase n=1 Tax=Luteimonas saliphila TaxID=2804919 RepID=UPI00192D5832|nr:HAD-IA family hydrolase [Luteimonas saliphila]
MTNALIVSGGGFQGLGLLEALQAIPGVRPIVADIHPDNVTRYLTPDYVIVPPLAKPADFAAAIRRLVVERDIDAVFPATARELPVLAGLRDSLAALGSRVAVSPPALTGVFLDKRATARFLLDHDLPTQEPVDPVSHDFSTTLFGKPCLGWGGTGTCVATDIGAVRQQESAAPGTDMVWFPLVRDFEEYSADFAISPSGHVSPIVLRKRLRTSGGYAVVSETVKDDALARVAAQAAAVIATANGRGIFNIQLIQAAGAEAFLSDVNPRFGTSAVHGLSSGINLAAFFLDDRPAPSRPSPAPMVRTVRYLRTIAIPVLDRRPKGIVFDLDDTLVDHKVWMAAKILGTYEAVARDWVPADTFRTRALQLVDEGERALLIDRLATCFSWTEAQRMTIIEAYRGIRIAPTPLYPDVEPVLSELAAAGFRLAILTDNPVATQRAKIEAAPALQVVSSIVYARDSGNEKPAASAFSAAATSLGLPPEDVCMVGDNYFRDALGAIRSGYSCAFLLQRRGGFVQHHLAITDPTPTGSSGDIHPIESLTILREALTPDR